MAMSTCDPGRMKRRGPHPLPLPMTEELRRALQALAASTSSPHRLVLRARIVLAAADGEDAESIARGLSCTSRSVRTWKARWRANPTVDSLDDLPRSGRPSSVGVGTRCELIALACERPDALDQDGKVRGKAAFRDVWTRAALRSALALCTGVLLSVSEIGRILRYENLRPHRVRYWLTSKDPDFAAKAARITDLYLQPPPGATVLCVDEKPVQVLGRRYPSKLGTDGTVHKEYEYIRRGTCCLLAAFDVRTGKVVARVVDQRTATQTVDFMEELARRHPRGEVWIVWDNLNTHYDGPSKRWTEFNHRHGNRFHLVYTPIHASWLNQVEIWFSKLQRRILTHADFASVAAAKARIESFVEHHNSEEARPYRWTWRYNPRHTAGRRAA